VYNGGTFAASSIILVRSPCSPRPRHKNQLFRPPFALSPNPVVLQATPLISAEHPYSVSTTATCTHLATSPMLAMLSKDLILIGLDTYHCGDTKACS